MTCIFSYFYNVIGKVTEVNGITSPVTSPVGDNYSAGERQCVQTEDPWAARETVSSNTPWSGRSIIIYKHY